ncbi:MAG: tRNA adenosine(34) deaminase TadA [Desulfobacterales bacterium]|nr:tRNA adenosine(34) deaminase TadA [Desulfobacterales bacterium]
MHSLHNNHVKLMALALVEAKKAGQKKEVPIGAVVVDSEGNVTAAAYNQVITRADVTAHAEILAMRLACATAKNYRLPGTTLFVTVEPCPMCMGAIIHARVERLVFGAFDPKWGAAGSLYNFAADDRFNHQPEVIPGVCEEACRRLMQEFFRAKRVKYL